MPVGPRKQKVSDRTARTCHPGEKGLIDVDDLVDRFFLTDHQLPQIAMKLFRFVSRL